MTKRILIAAGGSGGHLLPAQQLARQLITDHDSEVLFAGEGLKKSPFFQQEEFFHEEISSSSIRKGFALFSMGWKMVKGIGQSLAILRRYQPDVVVGFGSYHSFPMLFACWMRRKPLVVFEANCLLGKVNRLFAKKAKRVLAQFPLLNSSRYECVPFLPWKKKNEKIQRSEAIKSLGLQEGVFTLLVFGGSQGALFINSLVLEVAKMLKEKKISFQMIHLTGKKEGEESRVKSFYEKEKIFHFVRSFETDMNRLFSVADMAISRSGASTIAEMLYYQIPAILIPFPEAADSHQEVNARFFETLGGGVMALQKQANPEGITNLIIEMISKEKKKIADMKKRIFEYYSQESHKRCKEISQIVMEIAGE